MKTIKNKNMQSSRRAHGKNGFSLLAFCSSLLSVVLLALLMASCSADEDLTVTNRNMTRNADGSITIHRISSVALPNGFTAATRAIATRAGETTEAVDEKTSWAEGDRLHIGIVIGNYPSIETYRFATIQADGSWLLNSDVTIPASGTCYITFYYLGQKYNTVDFNDPTQNPDNIAEITGSTAWAQGTAVDRITGVYNDQTYKTADATTGVTTYSDILLAQGVCTDGTWNTTDSYNSVTANPADGVFSITMKHKSSRVAVTACDLSALGSGASVASITAKLRDNRSYSETPIYVTLNLFPASGTSVGTQPSETAPWKAQLLIQDYSFYLQSFVVTLTDGRKIPVSVPNASGAFDGIGREIDPDGGKAFVYRLTLSPGSCTATPDASFTAPGWQTGETGAPTPIYTRADLEAIASNLGGNYILMNDIDLSGSNWTPLGKTYAEAFTGKLNGNGHKITGMTTVASINSNNVGLFASTRGAIIYNLHFSNCTVQGGYGGVAGTLAGEVYNGCISNCSVTNGKISDNTNLSTGGGTLGGLIGYLKYYTESVSTVIHCHVSNCQIESINEGTCNLGGLIGIASANSNVIACYTNDCTLKIPETLTGKGSVGGLLGVLEGAYTLGCYASNVCTKGAAQTNGALIGYFSENFTTYGNLASCYATNASGSEATTAIGSGSLSKCSYVPLGATDYSLLVASPAASFSDINTAVLSSSGSLSMVKRTWKATGIWGESEGASISQAPLIKWSYNGE